MKTHHKQAIIALLILLTGFMVGRNWGVSNLHERHMQEHDHETSMGDREIFIGMKNDMIGEMTAEGDYKCCLENPCVYCIEKTPGHGEGAKCECLEDIMNGVHPCGECIGEILEGHGNRFIAKYFASAIAEEVGEQHIATLKEIISEKYGISVEEQI